MISAAVVCAGHVRTSDDAHFKIAFYGHVDRKYGVWQLGVERANEAERDDRETSSASCVAIE